MQHYHVSAGPSHRHIQRNHPVFPVNFYQEELTAAKDLLRRLRGHGSAEWAEPATDGDPAVICIIMMPHEYLKVA